MKYHQAKEKGLKQIDLWGSGAALREFIHTDDLADACLFLMEHYSGVQPINIGVGSEVSILELASLIKEIVGFEGDIVCDATKPDGMMRRMVDSTNINQLGWSSRIDLKHGLELVYREYLQQLERGI